MNKGMIILTVSGVLLLMLGCEEVTPVGLWDPDKEFDDNPVITSVTPDSAIAGFTQITIQGDNFVADSLIRVIFEDEQYALVADIISATATEIVIKSPINYRSRNRGPTAIVDSDTTRIRVSVIGALLFGEYFPYNLVNPLKEIDLRLSTDGDDATAQAIAVDENENVFIVQTNGDIKKVTSDGTVSLLGSTMPSVMDAVVGPSNRIYVATCSTRTIAMVSCLDGSYDGDYATGFTKDPNALDFDGDGNLWVATEDEIVLVKGDGSITSVYSSDTLTLDILRVFDGSVYVYGHNADYSVEKIWKSDIQGETLINRVEYLDVTAADWISTLNGFTLDENGDMYISTSASKKGVFVLQPDGSYEELYFDHFQFTLVDLVWGEGTRFYGTQVFAYGLGYRSKLTRVEMVKSGATYWGRQL